MNDVQCGTARERIPDYVWGRLPLDEIAAVDDHVTSCRECRAELGLAQMLFATRADVPSGLGDRVTTAVRNDVVRPQRPWWGISAAAVAALALGIGIASDPPAEVELEVPGYAYEVEEGALWSSDDGFFAGAPSLDGLSTEALEQLLDELVVGSSGGAA